MSLQPTMNLRIVEREQTSNVARDGGYLPEGTVRLVVRQVLQQQWTDTYGRNEWHDVPIIKEPT